MAQSPYEETLYLDSDVVACPGFEAEALWRAVGSAAVGGVTARGRSVNGGVLAYRPRAGVLFQEWERRYSSVMHETRREQPALQRALAWARANATGFEYADLGKRWNCRGKRSCGVGCFLLHDHFAFEAVDVPAIAGRAADEAALALAYGEACPALSGGHPLVALTGLEATDPVQVALEARLAELRKDNDAEACACDSDQQLATCASRRLRYGVVALYRTPSATWRRPLPPPGLPAATPVVFAWIRHPASIDAARLEACLGVRDCDGRLVRWFSGGKEVEAAVAVAKTSFAAVLVAERPRDSFRLLEMILPSHFLRLSAFPGLASLAASETPPTAAQLAADLAARRGPEEAAIEDDLQAQVLQLLRLDTQLYDVLRSLFESRLRACRGAKRRRRRHGEVETRRPL